METLPTNTAKLEYHKVYRPDTTSDWFHYDEFAYSSMDAIAQRCDLYDESDGLKWSDKMIRVITKTGGELITGSPGSGKSHLIKIKQAHLSAWREKHVTCACTHSW